MAGGFEKIDGMRLQPAVLSHDATMERGGKQMDLSLPLTITTTSSGGADSAGETGTWTLVSKIDMPRGTNTESVAILWAWLAASGLRAGGSAGDLFGQSNWG